MRNFRKLIPILAIALVVATGLVALATAEEDVEARKARILANLRLAFPQLAEMDASISTLEPSEFEGLDRGSFQLTNRGQQQTQNFLVAADDTKFYLVSGEPIDVSRSAEEIEAELAKQAADEQARAAERLREIEAAVAGRPVRGNPDAPVLIVEFSDFQCPYCARGATTVEQILEKYPDEVRFVFKHFPLNFHPWAKPASIAAHCAAQQDPDAFWTLHDEYFANQKTLNPGNVLAESRKYLDGSDVDLAAWSVCAEDKESAEYEAAAAAVDADMAFGQKLGVSGTPGFFVNGEFLNGAQPLAAFEPLIAKATAGRPGQG